MFPGIEMINDAVGVVAGVLAAIAGGSLLTVAVTVALYIFHALGLYTIAMRRGINNPWLAWLPVTDMWLLGSISDQYRYVFHGQIRNRRKVLVGLCIAMAAVTVVMMGAYIAVAVKLILQIPEFVNMQPQQVMGALGTSVLGVVVIAFVLWVLAVVTAVFRYVCMFDLYSSCNPSNKVLFLVLSILFPVAMPVLIFVCRNKDEGMPPRRDACVESFIDPVEE